MPELAEVEYYRRQWDAGMGERIRRVFVRTQARVLRGVEGQRLTTLLCGRLLHASSAHGKQMLFRFDRELSLGVHLGMTGSLSVHGPGYDPARHDHLVLFQARRALVFSDPRQFGRIRFDEGPGDPRWWRELPPPLISRGFTPALVREWLARHRRAPIKAVLLDQNRFPGLGNWMADEILWRAGLHPQRMAGSLAASEAAELWRCIRFVTRGALRYVAPAFGDPPRHWLFLHRWHRGGRCPKHRRPLGRATVGGRTTVWCDRCQPRRETLLA